MAIIIKRNAELSRLVQVENLSGQLFTGEIGGHTFEITLMRDGVPQTEALDGNITAYLIRSNNTTIGPMQGSASQGVCSVTLVQDCYNVPGRFALAIMRTLGEDTTCIYGAVGNIGRSQSGDLIDSGETVPSIDTLLAYIEACQTATTNANDAAEAAQQAAAAVDFVKYGEAQSLTDAQKRTARTNTGVYMDDIGWVATEARSYAYDPEDDYWTKLVNDYEPRAGSTYVFEDTNTGEAPYNLTFRVYYNTASGAVNIPVKSINNVQPGETNTAEFVLTENLINEWSSACTDNPKRINIAITRVLLGSDITWSMRFSCNGASLRNIHERLDALEAAIPTSATGVSF